ncbi:alcohol oxidase [Mycena latifolia]|nr:alcohol oxidase [Mycena latifolia]
MIITATEAASKVFDYVVVGGGTTGLTLAVRLSEDPSISILVIEAGPENLNDPNILSPATFGMHFGNDKYDWNLSTYHRPSKTGINAFGQLGNTGWNWDFLHPYYARSEQFTEPKVKNQAMSYDLAHHGLDGPLSVSYPVTMSNFEEPYQTALQQLGINLVPEPFAGDLTGTWLTPVTIDPHNRTRTYSANKFYQANAARINLAVVVSSHANKIVTEKGSDGNVTATGVVFTHDGNIYTARAGREVILSAGAIMSPQILELSGIGDSEILEKAGVEVSVHLPGVGCNVQEHFYAGVSHELREDIDSKYLTFDCLRDPIEKAKQQELYQTSGKGVFGMSTISMAFVPLASVSPAWDSIQSSLAESIEQISSGRVPSGLQKQYQIQLDQIKDREPSCEFVLVPNFRTRKNPPAPEKKHLTISTMVNNPFSRGSIHITSNDPLVPPCIDPRYFDQKYDLLTFVEQIKFCRKIFEQQPLKELLAGKEINPGKNVQTDEEISEYIKAAATTTWHTIGSCSMLPLTDGGVVDSKLKVYHTTNIRVIDVSIIPLHISAHLQGVEETAWIFPSAHYKPQPRLMHSANLVRRCIHYGLDFKETSTGADIVTGKVMGV